MKIDRDVRQSAVRTAESLGATVRFESGGKHAKIIVEIDGQTRRTPMSTSRRTDNRVSWVRQSITRMVKEMTG